MNKLNDEGPWQIRREKNNIHFKHKLKSKRQPLVKDRLRVSENEVGS